MQAKVSDNSDMVYGTLADIVTVVAVVGDRFNVLGGICDSGGSVVLFVSDSIGVDIRHIDCN